MGGCTLIIVERSIINYRAIDVIGETEVIFYRASKVIDNYTIIY